MQKGRGEKPDTNTHSQHNFERVRKIPYVVIYIYRDIEEKSRIFKNNTTGDGFSKKEINIENLIVLLILL
jgi:hypothetical protein